MAAGLDSNFRQDVWIRHFHGYGIGALFPPVSVKLENVFVCWISLLLCIRWREGGQAQSHEDFSGCHLGGGVGTAIKRVLMMTVMMTMEAQRQFLLMQWCYMMNLGIRQELIHGFEVLVELGFVEKPEVMCST